MAGERRSTSVDRTRRSEQTKAEQSSQAKERRRDRAKARRRARRIRRLASLVRLRQRRGDLADPWVRFRAGVALLLTVLGIGVVGYTILGLRPFDALFQTVITISTVGFSEDRVPNPGNPAYGIFTVALILLGTSSALYTLGVLMDTLFEGRLDDRLRRRHMRDTIEQMTDHTIICGFGQVGRAIAAELKAEGCELVIIDSDEAVRDDDFLIINADATEDKTLLEAGIEQAATLVLAFNSDVANLYVTLSARGLRPDLFIVVRTNSPDTVPKLESAGADRVINPNEIGAARMAAVARHPGVVTYLDELLPSAAAGEILVKEFQIPTGSELVGAELASSAVGELWPGAVLAVGRDGKWMPSPASDFVFSAEDVLVLLGNYEQMSIVINMLEPDL